MAYFIKAYCLLICTPLMLLNCLTSLWAQDKQWQNFGDMTNCSSITAHGEIIWVGTNYGIAKLDRDGNLLETFSTENILESSLITDVLMDGKGNTWFSSDKGVYKFNGIKWTHYTTDDGLVNNAVVDMAADLAGNMWFATAVGASKYDGTNWSMYTQLNGMTSNSLSCIEAAPDGRVWFGYVANGASSFDGASWVHYTAGNGLLSDIVKDIAFDSQGNIWFATFYGVSVFDGDAGWQSYTIYEGLPNNNVENIYLDDQDNPWFASESGVTYYDGSTWKTFTDVDGLSNRNVHDIAVDTDGNLWAATGKGISRYDFTQWQAFYFTSNVIDYNVVSIQIDAAGNKWFGTSSGVSVFDGLNWVHYTSEMAGIVNRQLLVDSKDVKWFASPNGLSRLEGSTWTIYTNSVLAENNVKAICEDPQGNIWVGYESSGVSKFDGTVWTHYNTQNGLINNAVKCMAGSANGIWIGTSSGISFFDGSQWKSFTTTEGMASNSILDIAVDQLNHIWIATDNGVSEYNGTSFKNYYTADGLPQNYVMAIEVDDKQRKWFGTSTGVSVYNDSTWITYNQNQGLVSNYVQEIRADNLGDIWFGTNLGVSRLKSQFCNQEIAFSISIDSASRTIACTDETVGSVSSWYWEFGDGKVSNEQHPTHKFWHDAYFHVCLTVLEKTTECLSRKCQEVGFRADKEPCNAEFEYQVNRVTKTASFFNASTSGTTNYFWEFGDGSSAAATDPVHSYAAAGFYRVTLHTSSATDDCVDEYTRIIRIGETLDDCEADFIYQLNTNDLMVSFYDQSAGENLNGWFWDFGDGETSTKKNPVHAYLKAGVFPVCLKVSSASCSNISCLKLLVSDGSVQQMANFDYTIAPSLETAFFADKSYGDYTKLIWNFGDGNQSSEANPAHTYAEPGFYHVYLTIMDEKTGAIRYVNDLINVNTGIEGLRCVFGYIIDSAFHTKGFFPTEFEGAEYGDPAEIRWDFGDGSTNTTSMSPTHVYDSSGIYNVCYTVSDSLLGQSYTYCKEIAIGSASIAEKQLPQSFVQAYPNPIAQTVHLNWQLTAGSSVTLSLYDMLGNQVKSILHEERSKGDHTLEWDASALPAGIYFLTLRTGEGSVTRKLVKR